MKKMLSPCTFALSCFIIICACTKSKPYHEDSGTVFHTLYSIKYQHGKLLTEKIDKELQDFNLSLNPFNRHSILYKVNNNQEVEVDRWFETVFNKSREVYEHSGGAFDPTVAPLINLWGFGYPSDADISQEAIDSLRQFTGFSKIHIENGRVIKDDPRIQLNFSAIAKGYASDVIALLLEREGVKNYIVEIGGEIVAKGNNPDGKCWQAAIIKPEDESHLMSNEIQAVIPICQKIGLATSGNYRNFRIREGKKYAHTIDPATGYPVENNILSATVIAADCMTADAYATTFMAMGMEAAIPIADKMGLAYYIIYIDSESGAIRSLTSEKIETIIK